MILETAKKSVQEYISLYSTTATTLFTTPPITHYYKPHITHVTLRGLLHQKWADDTWSNSRLSDGAKILLLSQIILHKAHHSGVRKGQAFLVNMLWMVAIVISSKSLGLSGPLNQYYACFYSVKGPFQTLVAGPNAHRGPWIFFDPVEFE